MPLRRIVSQLAWLGCDFKSLRGCLLRCGTMGHEGSASRTGEDARLSILPITLASFRMELGRLTIAIPLPGVQRLAGLRGDWLKILRPRVRHGRKLFLVATGRFA